MSKNNNTQKIVGLGLFTAIVIVLQLLGSFIKFGTFSVSLVLVPVVIGAALYGAGAGAWLGFVFGVVVLLSGDAAAFLGVNALGTILTVLVKGALAGFLSGVVYKALENKNRTLAVAVAAVAMFYNTSSAVSEIDSMFEAFSAFATVGLSVGVTATMQATAKLVTILTMFVGRVGPVALAISLAGSTPPSAARAVLPEGHVNVG